MALTKNEKYHHSITENGNLQLRIVTEYIKPGEPPIKTYSDPMTSADTKDMTGWDDKSKDIVTAITDEKVLADFAVEKITGDEPGNPHEVVTYDRTLDDLGRISIRRITRIFDDGKEVSKKYHRNWIMPGDDYTKADVMSKALAEKLHTPEVIVAYEAKMAELEKGKAMSKDVEKD